MLGVLNQSYSPPESVSWPCWAENLCHLTAVHESMHPTEHAHTLRQAPADLRKHFSLHVNLHNFNKAKYKTLQGQSTYIREKNPCQCVWNCHGGRNHDFICLFQTVWWGDEHNHQLLRRGTKLISHTQRKQHVKKKTHLVPLFLSFHVLDEYELVYPNLWQ